MMDDFDWCLDALEYCSNFPDLEKDGEVEDHEETELMGDENITSLNSLMGSHISGYDVNFNVDHPAIELDALEAMLDRSTPLFDRAMENLKRTTEREVIKEAYNSIPKCKLPSACSLCGAPMREIIGKYGPFAGCSNFPACQQVGHTIIR